MYKLALIFVSSVFVAMSPAVAAGAQDKWLVTQLSGDARVIHPGLQPASLKVNSEVVSGDTLVTGPNGRATLVRGADYIIIAPRSELRLPTAPEAAGFTRVVEKLGTMLFKIQHTGIPHFAVDTPMLAAVVKGTTFSITVDPNRSAVQVIQGAVQVTAVQGGMSRMVEGGRTVFVNYADPKTLLDADKPAPATAAPSSTAVRVSGAADNPLASVSQLTAGLVRVEADAPQTQSRVVLTAPEPVTAVTGVATTTGTPTATVGAVAATSVTVAGVTTPTLTSPAVAAPSVTVASVPTPVSVPGVSPPTVTVSPVTVALLSTPTVIVPSISTPTVTVPPLTMASLSTPMVTVPSVSTPTVTGSSVSVPSISTPTVTVPTVTVVSVSTPAVTVPSLSIGSNSGPGSINSGPGSINSGPGSINSGPGSVPTVPTPTVSTPTLSTPTITIPSITVPSVTTPIVTVPAITTPAVTVPSVTVPCLLHC